MTTPNPLIQYANRDPWRARCGSTFVMQTPQLMGGGLSALLPCSVCVYPYTPAVSGDCINSLEDEGIYPAAIRRPTGAGAHGTWPGLLKLEIISTTITHSPSVVGRVFGLVWGDDPSGFNYHPAGWNNCDIDTLEGDPLVMEGLSTSPTTLTHQISVGPMCDVLIQGGGSILYKFLAIRIGGMFGGGASSYTWVPSGTPVMPNVNGYYDVAQIQVSDWSAPLDETFEMELHKNYVTPASPGTTLGTMTVRLYEPT